MNIALISPHGMSTVIFCKTMAFYLTRAGHTVHTISPIDGYDVAIGKINSVHHEIKMQRGVSMLYDALYIYKLREILRSNNIESVITFTTKPNAYVWLYTANTNVKNIHIAVRGLGRVFVEKDKLIHKAAQSFLKYLYKVSMVKATTVWFTNQYDMEYLSSMLDKDVPKFILTKNAISIKHYSPSEKIRIESTNFQKKYNLKQKTIVVMVARLLKSKGVMEFLDSATNVSKKINNVMFVLVAPRESQSSDSIKKSYIESRVSSNDNLLWIEYMKDLRPLYYISDLAVLPSYYKEGGYPRALLEPMSFSKPVIAADTDECRGVVDPNLNGLLVNPMDSLDLSEKIIKILSSKKILDMGRHSRSIIEDRHDDTKVIKDLLLKMNLITKD